MEEIMLYRILFNLLLFITYLKFSDAVDTLSQTETLGSGQTLVSQNQVFEVGFFNPGASTNRFFGIWIKTTPKVIVWVANRNNPITESQGVEFSISRNGSLAINRTGSIIWSSNPSVEASNPVLQLLDTGNLVLVENTTTAQRYLWQSFDFPTDNWLPGMKLVDDSDVGVEKYLQSWRNPDDPSPGEFVYRIENEGLPELVLLREGKKMFRTGTWNGDSFGGIQDLPNGTVVDYSIRDGRLIYLARPVFSSAFSRLALEPSGLLQRYNLNARRDTWNAIIEYPRDKCDEYSNCGPNALCSTEKTQVCECFRGFSPKSPDDWNGQDWSGGCDRITPLDCEGGDGFVEVRKVKYPDMLRFWLNNTMSLEECKAECLKNCSCTACANPYITDGGSGCLMWFDDLIDIRQFPYLICMSRGICVQKERSQSKDCRERPNKVLKSSRMKYSRLPNFNIETSSGCWDAALREKKECSSMNTRNKHEMNRKASMAENGGRRRRLPYENGGHQLRGIRCFWLQIWQLKILPKNVNKLPGKMLIIS